MISSVGLHIIAALCMSLIPLQMTWISNELEGFDMIVIEFLDRLSEPRGWLVKLWECLLPRGLVVVADAGKWDKDHLQTHIEKW